MEPAMQSQRHPLCMASPRDESETPAERTRGPAWAVTRTREAGAGGFGPHAHLPEHAHARC